MLLSTELIAKLNLNFKGEVRQRKIYYFQTLLLFFYILTLEKT
ncbi:hypothetical protein Lepto7376_3340 [[Leptolyngbya] sp. PCC 7376]|nr:hypothetical protein Lepto7376_3340 [[Leptolyngbya] sp. PCC 7376]